MSFFTWSADKNGGSVARFKTSSSCSILFSIYLKLRILYKHLLSNLFFINILRFLRQIFLVRKRWVHETVSSTRITGAVTNPSSTKLSNSKWKNAVLNPLKSFLAVSKVNPRILSTFKRSFSKKKMEKHRAHTLSTRQKVNTVEESEIANQSDCLNHQDHWVVTY